MLGAPVRPEFALAVEIFVLEPASEGMELSPATQEGTEVG